uniref:Si:dkey-112e7.2 n=1 Tax=Sinocyclocheilus rhinocerous TaxID=307959 RepID=A0A673NKX3_9TELE
MNLFEYLKLVLSLRQQTAEAFDGGDAAALLLGATVTLVGICACLVDFEIKKKASEHMIVKDLWIISIVNVVILLGHLYALEDNFLH